MNDSLASGELGSLAQSARKKQLKSARGILMVIGVLTLLLNGGMALFAERVVDWQIKEEIAKIRKQGMVVDQAAVDEIRPQAVSSMRLGAGLWTLMGIVFLALAFKVYEYPVQVTIAGLVLYVGCTAISFAMAPEMVGRQVIVKILFIVALFKAVQAAVASEREKSQLAAATVEPVSV